MEWKICTFGQLVFCLLFMKFQGISKNDLNGTTSCMSLAGFLSALMI